MLDGSPSAPVAGRSRRRGTPAGGVNRFHRLKKTNAYKGTMMKRIDSFSRMPFSRLAALTAVVILSIMPYTSHAQYTNWTPFYDEWQNMKGIEPRQYISYKVSEPIVIDGDLEEAAWHYLPWTEFFIDIEGSVKPRPYYRTQAKIAWDDSFLYFAGDIEDYHVWGTLTEHDAIMYFDNNFEIFIEPDNDSHHYYELEINALNSVWDLMLHTPYRDGGERDSAWSIPGLETAIKVHGTLNDPSDRDSGWSVEVAIPWTVLAEYADTPSPPRDGDSWRINFSRAEWEHEIVEETYAKPRGGRCENWVWSPPGVINMHCPEKWGYVQFSTAKPGTAQFTPEPTEPARMLLHDIYYAQRDFYRRNDRYAASIGELGLAVGTHENVSGSPSIQLTAEGYLASVTVESAEVARQVISIRQDSKISVARE